MGEFKDVLQNYFPMIALALSIVVFAVAPLVIYLIRGKEITKRAFLILTAQCAWLLLANAIFALSTVGYFFRKYGDDYGLLLSICATAFGGTLALGLYETVLSRRLALGRAIESKVVNFLTIRAEGLSEREIETEKEERL